MMEMQEWVELAPLFEESVGDLLTLLLILELGRFGHTPTHLKTLIDRDPSVLMWVNLTLGRAMKGAKSLGDFALGVVDAVRLVRNELEKKK